MSIHALITHHIHCEAGAETSLTLASEALPCDEQATALVDALKNSFFSRLTREHGSFASADETAPLPRELDDYTRHQDFAALTRRLMEDWKTLLDRDLQDIDAGVVFLAETNGEQQVFYMLVAGYKTAFSIGPDLAIETTRHLDLGSALFGIKVDMHEWLTARHYAYLSLVPPRSNRKLAEGYTALTGFSAGLDKTDTTEAFLAGVEAFAKQVDQDRVDSYRHQVVDYCAQQEQRDAPIDLQELSRSVDGIDGDRFSRFMADYTPERDSALMMDRRSLRRYVKFTGREKDLAISFSSSQLNSRVHYNPDKDTLSIDGIPRTLREQLLRHLNQ